MKKIQIHDMDTFHEVEISISLSIDVTYYIIYNIPIY